MPSIFEELKEIDMTELITRMVSLEFNRFLEYYRNAEDLNIDFSKKDHVRDSDTYKSSGNEVFINLGIMDGFDNGRMLKYLSETTGLPSEAFGRINLKSVYSFIGVQESYLNDVLGSFKNEVYKGRKVRVDSSGGARERKSSPQRGRKEFEKRGSKRKYYGPSR